MLETLFGLLIIFAIVFVLFLSPEKGKEEDQKVKEDQEGKNNFKDQDSNLK